MPACDGRLSGMATTGRPSPSRPSQRDVVRRLVLVVGVLAGLGLLVGAAFLADTDGGGDPVAVRGDAVETLTPAEDAEVLQQQPIEIDLATGWTGELSINGVAIPEDQLLRNEGLATIGYQPGEGKIVSALRPGPNCVDATIWRIAEGPDGPSEQLVTWCFQAT